MAVKYPLVTFHFQVEWGGARLGFTEVSGLDIETKVIEYREGNSPEYHVTKMPGMQQYGNITMKRGIMAADADFVNWWNTVALNTIERRDVTIKLLNEKHEPVVTWRVKRAWPTKVTSPSLNSTGNEAAIESIELAHEGLVIEHA